MQTFHAKERNPSHWVVVRSSDGRAIRHYSAGIDAIAEARRLNAYVRGKAAASNTMGVAILNAGPL